jgi:hypothetical protein
VRGIAVAGIASFLVHERYRVHQHRRRLQHGDGETVTHGDVPAPSSRASVATPQPTPTPPPLKVTVLPPHTPAALTLLTHADEGPSLPPSLTDAGNDADLTSTQIARRWLEEQRRNGRDLRTIKSTEVTEVSELKSHARKVLQDFKAKHGVEDTEVPG